MKKTLACIIGLICLLAAFAYAADQTATESSQGAIIKSGSVKTAKMNARGKVVEISDKAIKIERSIKGNVEIMEFALEAPVADIAVNDSVKIDYSVKDGILSASSVAKPGAVKNPKAKEVKPTEKSAPGKK